MKDKPLCLTWLYRKCTSFYILLWSEKQWKYISPHYNSILQPFTEKPWQKTDFSYTEISTLQGQHDKTW
jgi:hypothetical protein